MSKGHPTMSYTATAQPIDGTLRHEIDVNGRHTIVTDEPARLGGSDTAPTPYELLAATLAACVSTMLVLYARARDLDLRDLRVDVDYESDRPRDGSRSPSTSPSISPRIRSSASRESPRPAQCAAPSKPASRSTSGS
jgi:organic hydroperoxide reductase OsmC/OhrA